MEKELRRSRSTLQILGAGVILFALWDVVKLLLVTVLTATKGEMAGTEAAESLLAENVSEEMTPLAVALLALILLLPILSTALRVRIGRAARAEGLGKPHRGYVGLAFVFFAVQVLVLALGVWGIFSGETVTETPLQLTASLCLELCSIVTMGEVGFTALKARKLQRLIDRER